MYLRGDVHVSIVATSEQTININICTGTGITKPIAISVISTKNTAETRKITIFNIAAITVIARLFL
jgi:hypothetical protein